MTQTNLTRPQGLSRIDPALRDAAAELGIVEFLVETLPAEREHANRVAAERAAAVNTTGVVVESRTIPGPDGRPAGPSVCIADPPTSRRRCCCTPTAAPS